MPRPRSTSGEIDDLPVYFRRAHDIDRSWSQESLCRNHQGVPAKAWVADPAEKVEVAGVLVKGEELEHQAAIVCQSCPVQWQCASFAVIVGEKVGTWAVKHATIAEMIRDPRSLNVIAWARERSIPVKVAWDRYRAGDM